MGKPHATTKRSTLVLTIVVLVAILIPAGSALSARGSVAPVVPVGADTHYGHKGEIDANACPERPRPGTVTCFARERIDPKAESLVPAREHGPTADTHKRVQTSGAGSTNAGSNSSVGDNGAYSPLYLESAYNAPSTNPGGTVAIVDAYDDPNAESDLASYRSYYGLSPCTTANGCFRKVDQRGGSVYPQPDATWALEMSLDLDMVSAICPNCHIVLVEADSNSWTDLGTAVSEGVALGASAVSMSWGGFEYSGETTDNRLYYDHPGVAMVASSGDGGYSPQFPASSPDVVSVGGTTLNQATDTGTRDATETVWSGSGGGCSNYFPKATWQQSTGCSGRTMNDVAAVADPNTGVWVWDTYHGNGWGILGGTSVSAPIVAAMYALAGNPSSGTEMPSTLYGAGSGFNDVTSGFNGACGNTLCVAGPGWDGPTGFGTPNGITPFLLSSAPVSVPTPTSLTAAYGHSIDLAWDAPVGMNVSKYIVERDGTQIATTTNTYYYDDAVSSGGTYSYDVRAVDASGNVSGPSNVATANVPASTDTTPPKTPSGLHLAVAGTTQSAIYWSPSTDNVGVTGYNVYRDGVLVAQTTAPNYLDTGLAPGSSHAYTVAAFDAAGNVSTSTSKLNVKTVALSTATTSTVVGVVYASTGKPLANAVVTLTGNGLMKTAKTSNAGVYKFSSLPVATYTLTVTNSSTPSSASPQGTSVTVVAGQTIVLVAGS